MKRNHRCKEYNPKIGVVIPARNESNNIAGTLFALLHQSLLPEKIIVVDDNSNDDTKTICESMGVQVISFPFQHENWVIKKELAYVFNVGLYQLPRNLDYVMILGADHILSKDYLKDITVNMVRDNITIASGKIGNEKNTIPRGSGRLVDWQWWTSINGGLYPINYGYESWLIARCRIANKECKVYDDIPSNVSRVTGTNYKPVKFIHRGQAFRALGYNKRFVIGRFIVMVIKLHQPFSAVKMIQGYIKKPEMFYEDSIRNYFREYQNNEMSLKNIGSLFRKFNNA